jgi:hypothetical protein
MTGRTGLCDDGYAHGRMKKASEFLDAATLLASDDYSNASVNLLVNAGIAAADVICCARLGVHAKGENHNEAASLLAKADPAMEKHLRVLLGIKSKVAYTHEEMSAQEQKKSMRAAEALVEAARRVSSTR